MILYRSRKAGYHDFLIRTALSLVAAHFIVSFGEPENFFQLLLLEDYWRSLAASFVIAFLLVNCIYGITVWLDRRYDWKKHPLERALLQAVLALLLPSIAAFLLAFVYFRLYGINIFVTRYLRYDFPVIILMLLLVNCYYLAFYFFRQWQAAAAQPKAVLPEQAQAEKNILVQKGTVIAAIPFSSISYFYHENGHNFLRTTDKEDYLVSQSLDEVAPLAGKKFFRANRQFIVNVMACDHFTPLPYNKLELFTDPPFKHQIVISQKRSKAFKEWMEQPRPQIS